MCCHCDEQGGCTHLCFQVAWCSFANNFSVVDNGNAIGKLVGFFEVLRGEQHRGAFAVQSFHFFPQRESTHGVEASGGFIEKEHSGLVNERQRKVETTAHSARVRTNTAICCGCEAYAFKELIGTLFHLICWNAV